MATQELKMLLRTMIAGAVVGASLLASSTADAQRDRRVQIINDTRSTIIALYGSRVSTNSWEEQILDYTIPPGQSSIVNFDDGTGACRFDFYVKLRDGRTARRNDYNVCEGSRWRIYDAN